MASLLMRSVSTVPGHTALTAMPAGPELGGHGLGQQDDPRLGGAVGAEEREGALAGLARDVADAAAHARRPPSGWRRPSRPARCRPR